MKLRNIYLSLFVVGSFSTVTAEARKRGPLNPINAAQSGRHRVGTNIVGGSAARSQDFPFMVALLQGQIENPVDAFFCGATLLDSTHLLTAAHCAQGEYLPENIDALVGTHDLSKGGMRIRVVKRYIHPAYDYDTVANDIAVLTLARRVPRHLALRLELPLFRWQFRPGAHATAVGWGSTYATSPTDEDPVIDLQTTLRRVTMPIIANDDPGVDPELADYLTDNDLLAGKLSGGTDTCYGDSGGPLLARGFFPGTWYQVGITSWGNGCGFARNPGVSVKVFNYRKWIVGILRSEE